MIVGFLSLYEAIRLYPYGTGLFVGDHAFPGIVGIIFIFTGFLYFLFPRKEVKEPLNREKRNTMFIVIGILLIYCYSILFLGYFISTLLAFFILLKAIGKYRFLFSIIFSTIATTAFYYLFIVLLKTPLPTSFQWPF